MAAFGYTGGPQHFRATAGGFYSITATGAAGGSSSTGGTGGPGAEVGGEFELAAGTILSIIVGGQGGYGAGSGAGGGGASDVVELPGPSSPAQTTLLVAGGGGGSGADSNAAQGNGETSGLATTSGSGAGGAGGMAGAGGGGGGGGYQGGSGGAVAQPGQPGASTAQNASGGASASGGPGGYGGGGGGGQDGGGGGGGGYGGGAGGSGAGDAGTGGGSLDLGQDALLASGIDSGAGSVIITPLCFLRGTRILTPTGEVRVEDLQLGDAVVTRFGGIQPVKWIGRHSPAPDNEVNTPVCIHAGALGERLPARDLYVSPGHSLLVDGSLLIASLLVNGVTVTQSWCPPRIDYFHVELATHDCVIAEGAWAETYADAQISRDRFANAAEYDLLYPEAGPAPDAFTLCAPRPEQGAKLEAALRPVLARIAVTPGPLQGSIDRIDGAWRVQGWAHDPAHPDLPVLLEVELDGQVIGTVAACEQRDDLAQAGFARGRCAFTFTSPVRLRPERLHSLRIRRAADGASLPLDQRAAPGSTIAAAIVAGPAGDVIPSYQGPAAK